MWLLFKNFDIEEVQTSLLDKTIYIKATLDLDKDTVNKNTVEVTESKTKRIVQAVPEVTGRTIKIVFHEWPVPNTEYLVKIQKGVRSALGDDLPASLRRHIVFTSEIKSLVNITYPANFQEIDSLYFKWTEEPQGSNSKVGSYLLEIAEENAFYNIVRSSYINDSCEVTLKNIPPGQYFARIRAEYNEQYGPWSDTVTFVLTGASEEPEDIGDPIVEEDLELIDRPDNGETPQSFILRFNSNINPEDVEIVVYRRTL